MSMYLTMKFPSYQPHPYSGITGGNKYCLQLAKMIVVTAGSCDREEPTVNNVKLIYHVCINI